MARIRRKKEIKIYTAAKDRTRKIIIKSILPGLLVAAGAYHTLFSTIPDEKFTKNSVPISLAYSQSFGLFDVDSISNSEWERGRQKIHTQSIYKNPLNPLENIDDELYWITNNIFPNFDCLNNTAIGGLPEADGTKFVCNPERLIHEEKKDCLVYSVGCAGMYTFEDALYEMSKGGCEIHVFDPAPNFGRPNDPTAKNIHYHAWGFVSTYDKESKSNVWPKGRSGGFKTVPETLKELGHEDRTIDIFKMDCEGCEWSTYMDFIGIGARQILVENHGVPLPDRPRESRSKLWIQKSLNVSAYYDEYKKHGYALFNRDFHNSGPAVDLAYIKLAGNFWEK